MGAVDIRSTVVVDSRIVEGRATALINEDRGNVCHVAKLYTCCDYCRPLSLDCFQEVDRVMHPGYRELYPLVCPVCR